MNTSPKVRSTDMAVRQPPDQPQIEEQTGQLPEQIQQLNQSTTQQAADIPISAAKQIAELYGYDQVVIVARKTGVIGHEHVTTYGVNKRHCEIAAKIGDFFKYKIMGWPSVK